MEVCPEQDLDGDATVSFLKGKCSKKKETTN